jgi:cytoskeletal protein RodZ
MANFGETLKQARAHKGVTLKEAEQATRINRNHLAALEDESFSALPPLIYQRGIVRNYAMYLGLDPSRVLSLFEEARGGEDVHVGAGVEAVPPVNMPSHWAPNFAIIAFSVVLSAIVFAWVYSAFVQPPDEASVTPEIVATVTPFANDVALPTEPPPTPTPTVSPTPEVPPTTAAERVDTGRALPTESTQSGGGDNQLNQGAQAAEQAPATEQTAAPAAASSDGAYVTSIAVTAVDDIFVSVVADGVPVFEGDIPAGQTTAYFNGSVFEVYTSSGANTMFLNSCDAPPFSMGYEPGEAFYILEANADSCAPIG